MGAPAARKRGLFGRLIGAIVTLVLLLFILVAAAWIAARPARPDAFYSVRGFVRVDRANGCPPELFWSQPSVQYQIAPWYENANTGLPLPRKPLAISDPGTHRP